MKGGRKEVAKKILKPWKAIEVAGYLLLLNLWRIIYPPVEFQDGNMQYREPWALIGFGRKAPLC